MAIITALKYLKAENNYFMRQKKEEIFKCWQLIYTFPDPQNSSCNV